jgi:hypothetical protein
MPTGTDGVARAGGERDAVLAVEVGVDVPEGGAALDAVAVAVAVDAAERREVDDRAAVVAGDEVLVAVPAAADRDPQALVDGALYGGANLLGVGAQLDVAGRPDPAEVEAAHERRVARVVAVDVGTEVRCHDVRMLARLEP